MFSALSSRKSIACIAVAIMTATHSPCTFSREADTCAYLSPYGLEDKNVQACSVTINRGIVLNGRKGDLATFLFSGGKKVQAWTAPQPGMDPIAQGGCWPNIHERDKRCPVWIKTSESTAFIKAESFYNGMNCQKPFKRDSCVTILGLEGKYAGAKILTWGYNLSPYE
jgi:hypothetical protein